MHTPAVSIEAAEGTVVGLRPGRATVRVEAGFSCPRCAAGRGCGAAFLAGRDGGRLVEVTLPPAARLRIGDRVGLLLEPSRVLQAAWLAYGIPLVSLLGGALAAQALLPAGAGDGAVAGLAVAGLLAGGWWARRRLLRAGCLHRFLPSLVSGGRESSPSPQWPAPGPTARG